MKPKWNRIMNLLMGVLLLITLTYSIPSVPRQRNVSQTEWIKKIKQGNNQVDASSKFLLQNFSSSPEFAFRILHFNSRLQVSFKLSKSFQFIDNPTRLVSAKIFSNDDDYLLS